MGFILSFFRLLIQNVTNNVLPWTMKKLPKTYQLMMELENQNPDDSVKLLLLRIAKENFFLSLSEKVCNFIYALCNYLVFFFV